MIKSKSVKACGVGLTAQINEARKVLCHNRGVVIQSVHELGIETSFREVRMDKEPKKHQTFKLGDNVRILSGPFVLFTGKIEGINQSKALLKVRVAIYGRNEPIRLNFSDVEIVPGS